MEDLARKVTLLRAEKARLQQALEWALDVLEISLARIDTIDGDTLDERHYAIREAGLAKAREALAGQTSGSGSSAADPSDGEAA